MMAKITKVEVEATKEKICEAQHFLDKIEETQNDPKPFNYNLSAFLEAFRSIEHFMKKELTDPNLDPCYKKLRKWMNNDHHVQLLTQERNITTHERIISKRSDVAAHVPPLSGAIAQIGSVSGRIVNEDGSVIEFSSKEAETMPAEGETTGEKKTLVKYTWYFTLNGNTRNDQIIRNIPGINTIIQTDVVTIRKDCFKDFKNRAATCDKDLISC